MASSPSLSTHTSTLYLWPITAKSPSHYGQVQYNAHTSIGSFIPTSESKLVLAVNDIVRIGTYDKTGQWVGSVFTGGVSRNGSVTIRTDYQGNLWQSEYDTVREHAKQSLSIVRPLPGAMPILAKPVILNADGKLPVQEPEKTFLQRYWWVLLGGLILVISGGGGSTE
ncbi:hypothetical protein EDC01DRAFT_622222 [Geopyxis carbonaria]|nr:hypothetical protein EDC01DRAFT_622222 [Geopyxis carbonaria]